jgi:hypothetical protein
MEVFLIRLIVNTVCRPIPLMRRTDALIIDTVSLVIQVDEKLKDVMISTLVLARHILLSGQDSQ